MYTRFMTTAIAGTAAIATLTAIAPASAQVCDPLEVVNGEGSTEVTKTVSPPGTLLLDTNWNTDFTVDESYDYFVVNFTSENGEMYDVDVNLKYPNDSTETEYSVRDEFFPGNETVTIQAEPRVGSTPYQVNLRVGGFDAEGNTYTASVVGCR